jgi:WD40 repeat protein
MDMKKMQHRMMELNNEFERVLAIESDHNIVSSPLLHGSRQAFSKSDLEKQLQKESVMCQKQISQWRAEIYRLDTERSHLSNEIVLASRKLNDRKDLMLRLEDQYFTMQNLRSIGSHQTGDVLQFYVARWRAQRKKRVEIKETLDWLGQYCRRQRLTDAWSKLQVKQRPSRSFESESGGISNKLISTAEASTIDDNTAALGLALELAAAMDEQSSSDGNIDFLHRFTSANHLSIYLPSNDDIIILQKGSFYMQAGNYQPALRCFEHVMSNASSEQYFCGIDEPNRITILSVLYGMLAEVYYKLGKPDMAIVYFNRQLSLSQEIGVEWAQISALFGLGRCYFSKSEIEYAHSLFNKALEAMASMTDSSSSNLSVVYHWLKKCLVNMNQMDRADLIQGKLDEVERDERKEKVEASLSAMDRMKQHLVDLNARKSQVVALEAASATSILLQREKLKKEKLLIEYDENLTKLHESIEKLRDLETQLQLEIDIASSSKKGRIISHLINGAAQEVKTKELITRLQGQLSVVNAKKDESCKESERLRLLIHNTKDEVSSIIERISVEEGPLMQRVLKNNRNYRCMKLNPSNTMRNDVSGCSKGCIELLASSRGQELYLHNVSTGRLESVFTGDREGTHIGEVNGHTKTITSLCWFGKEIYTGGMDCCIIGWCTRTMKKLRVYKGHEGGVNCLCVTSSQIFSGGADKMIILWNKSDGSIIRRVHGHSRGVHHVFGTSIPSSNLIMVSASYGEVFCWKEDISSTVRL